MACGATLKRSLDFDPLHTAVSTSPNRVPPIISRTPPAKRRRLSARCGTVFTADDCQMSPLSRASSSALSPFKNTSQLSSEQVLKNIYDEYKRMKRRRQLQMNQPTMEDESNPTQDSIAGTSSGAVSSLLQTSSQPGSDPGPHQLTDKKITETPLLTMKQVGLICERLLKEQEEKLRTEYDRVLVAKLSEQYDAFVKFNYDQVQRRMGEHPASYVS